ncbi:MAG: MaoC family dehydratase [Arenicellales bacterium]
MIKYYLEDLSIGMSDAYTRTITDEDIQLFAQVSGDNNPMHLDDEYAANTPFKQRIAHGMLSASFISTVVGTRLPGPGSIYVNQTLKFRRPVKIGDEVITHAEITDINSKRAFVTLKTVCQVNGKNVIEGEALMMVTRRG